MAAKAVIRFSVAAAMSIAAGSALAQTNDPGLTQTQIDCLNRTNAAAADCNKDGGDTKTGGKDSAGATPGTDKARPALCFFQA